MLVKEVSAPLLHLIGGYNRLELERPSYLPNRSVRDFQLWLKADIFNVFDEDAQIAGSTSVDGDFSGPLDDLGLPTTFTEPNGFGEGRNNGDFVNPFEYRFTVGFRF